MRLSMWMTRLGVVLVALLGYALTVAPTTSYWDCGEFIAAAHVLGIPHPPGTPFFSLLGRVWILLHQLWWSPAQAINWLSALASVGSCVIAFEIVHYLLGLRHVSHVIRQGAGFAAGTLLAFSDAFWFNAVEAEVYGTSLFFWLLGLGLILLWDRDRSPRWWILFVYLSFLGMGVHTNSMLLLPLGWLWVGWRQGWLCFKRSLMISLGILTACVTVLLWWPQWSLLEYFDVAALLLISGLLAWNLKTRALQRPLWWLCGAVLFSFVIAVQPFLLAWLVMSILCLALSWIPWSGFNSQRALSRHLLILLGVAMLGTSVHIYLPIRSSTEPLMDQNNPETWEEVRDALERRQYGSMGMLQRSLWRRAEPLSQLGFFNRIGYLGYHLQQYFPAPLGAHRGLDPKVWSEEGGIQHALHRVFFELLLVFVLIMLWQQRQDPHLKLLGGLFAFTSLGLIFYVNFADGTRPDSAAAVRWYHQIQQVKQELQDPSLPPLPSPQELSKAYNQYRQISYSERSSWLRSPEGEPMLRLLTWHQALTEQGKGMPVPPGPVHGEVRERDYFFTPAFVVYTLLVALWLGLLLQKVSPAWQRRLVVGCYLLWIPVFLGHFAEHNRSGDTIARDYAWNILQSVPPQGILFTFGDNDTFPLWYLQMVEGIRTDVMVVNTSLAYSDWYQDYVRRMRPDLQFDWSTKERQTLDYQPQPMTHFVMGTDTIPWQKEDSWRPSAGALFISNLVRNNYPRLAICYPHNAPLHALPGGQEQGHTRAPVSGMVRQLGLSATEADSLLLYRALHLYHYPQNHSWLYQEATRYGAAGVRLLLQRAMNLAQTQDDQQQLLRHFQMVK